MVTCVPRYSGLGAACPPQAPIAPDTPFVTPLRPKYRRYEDQGLHEAYTHVVSALRQIEVPVYGKVVDENQADQVARQMVDGVRKLATSKDLQTRLRCAVEPPVRNTVGQLLLGAMAVSLLGAAGAAVWSAARDA